MAVEGHRHQTISDSDHGPIVDIIAWYTMVVMVLAVCLRLLVRNVKNVMGVDDLLCVPAMVSSSTSAQTVCSSSTALRHWRHHCFIVCRERGFGQETGSPCADTCLQHRKGRLTMPSSRQNTQLMALQDVYIATILYLLTLSFAKASTLVLIFRLVREKAMRLMVYVLGAVTSAWIIASVFAISFQCGLPQPWAYLSGKCFSPVRCPSSVLEKMLIGGQLPFWIPVGAVDIVTDIAVIILPAWGVWDLQMGTDKKIIVIAAFSFRVLSVTPLQCRCSPADWFL